MAFFQKINLFEKNIFFIIKFGIKIFLAKQKNTCLFIADKEPKKIISFKSATSTVNLIWNDPYVHNMYMYIISYKCRK